EDPRLAERFLPESPFLVPGELPVIETAAEARALSAYHPPPGARLDEVKDAMTVTCHVSPDQGFQVLSSFLAGTRERLTVGMFDFSAPHVRDGLKAALSRRPPLHLTL